jgi:hypothetical protein
MVAGPDAMGAARACVLVLAGREAGADGGLPDTLRGEVSHVLHGEDLPRGRCGLEGSATTPGGWLVSFGD